jgi:uncharacterized membrane protein YdjX (TVP38/TMEM64 family)
MRRDDKIKALVSIAVVIAAFIAITFVVQNKLINTRFLSQNSVIAVIIYILILVLEAVIAPINTMPLIPLASDAFGWLPTAIYTLLGWTLGSSIVFIISQRYGKSLVNKLVPMNKLEKYERIIPTKHIFLNVVLLRIFVPLDIVSYALGLFTNIKKEIYIPATIIGYAPLAFLIAYLGTLSSYYLIAGGIICAIIILIDMAVIFKNKNSNKV